MPRIFNFTVARSGINLDMIIYHFTTSNGGAYNSCMGVIRNLNPNIILTDVECKNLVLADLQTNFAGDTPDNHDVDICY